MRGQSRGVQSSWFSWGAETQDESGETTNEKEVGFFKGCIRVVNNDEDTRFMKDREYKMDQIFDLIRNIHQKAFNKPLEITRKELTSIEKQMQFINTLESMDIAHPTFIEFLKD